VTEQELRNIMRASVAIVCQGLTDLELAVLNNVAQLDGDPRGRLFDYSKVAMLFDQANGTRMHEETKRALAAIVNARLG
jgi:hypothetical protein